MQDAIRCNRLEHVLGLFTQVQAGEGRRVGVLSVQACLVMIAFYLVRPVREALILTEGDAELRSYAVGLQALLLLGVIPLYGVLVRSVPSHRVFRCVAAFFVSNLVLFYLLGQAGFRIGFPFFVWAGLFGVMAVAQFWAFASDALGRRSGRRLFGIVGVGVAAGAWLGAQLASAAFQAVGPYGLMVAAAGALTASILVSGLIAPQRRATARIKPDGGLPVRPARWLGGFAVIARSRYLVGIAAIVVLLNWITSTGDFLLASWLVEVASREAPGEQSAFVGRFMGGFCATITLAALALQLLVVSRVIDLAGLPRALMVTPVALVAGYLVVGVLPLFMALQAVLVVQRSLDYSLMSTSRHALFLAGGREVRYEAKTVIDTFFFRVGDLLSTASIFVGLQLSDDGPHRFVWLIFALSLALLLVVWLVGREYLRREAAQQGSPRSDSVGDGRLAVAAQ